MTELLVLTGQQIRLELQRPPEVLRWVESLPADVRSEISVGATVGMIRSLVVLVTFCVCGRLEGQFNDTGFDLQQLPQVQPGFRVELFAAEPLVRQPCAMAFDSRGRLLIGMGPQYRNPTPETPGDSVVLVLDADGDGRAETTKVFATGFNAIQGLAWRGGDLWVANAPDLTLVRDLDGDDLADEYVKVYTDLGNLEHGLHGLNWAPDGRLYMSKGNSKGLTERGRVAPKVFRDLWGVTAPAGTPDVPPPQSYTAATYSRAYHDPADDWGRAGGILRCEDGGLNPELVSEGFRNPWDIACDSGFNWLGTDNDQNEGDRVFMSIPGGQFGWNHAWSSHWGLEPHLPTAPVSGPLFEGSGTGVVFGGGVFPDSYQGVFFINDWLQKRTYVWRPSWDGALLKPAGGEWSVFVEGGRALYRPTDLEFGPDGALWVLGWSSGYGAEWQNGELKNEGRVYRIAAESPTVHGSWAVYGSRGAEELSERQLISQFSSPSPVHRTDAQRELLQRGAVGRRALLSALEAVGADELVETWCLWTLGLSESGAGELDGYFRGLAADSQCGLNRRIQAVRILADRRHRRGDAEALPAEVTELLTASEPRLRLATVLAVQETRDRQAMPLVVRLAEVESDRVVSYVVWQTMRRLLSEADLTGLLRAESAGVRRSAFLALAEGGRMTSAVAEGLAVSEPVARLWLERMKSGAEALVVRGRPLNAGQGRGSGASQSAQIPVVSLLESVSSRGGGAYRAATTGLQAGATIYTDRGYQFRSVPAAFQGAEYVLTANNDDGSSGTDFLTLQALLPVVVTVAWDQRNQVLPDWLTGRFRELPESIEADHWRMRLFQGEFPAGLIVLGGNTVDGQSGGKSQYSVIVQMQSSGVAGEVADVERVLSAVPQASAKRGEVLFYHPQGPGCFRCHSVDGSRNGFGPGLSELGRRVSLRQIVQSLVEPSAVITEGFRLQSVVTQDGLQHAGVLLEESGVTLTLGLPTGERISLPKEQIEERRSEPISAMPVQTGRLSVQEFADLAAWLTGLTGPPSGKSSSAQQGTSVGDRIQQKEDRLILSDADGLIGEYVFRDPKILRPYFAGLKSVSGFQVTRNHPPQPGVDAVDHDTMHPGLWLGLGDFTGSDFWRNRGEWRHVRFAEEPRIENGEIRFATESEMRNEQGEILGSLLTRIRVLSRTGQRMIVWTAEFSSEQRDLVFGDQEEMGFGARVATSLTEKSGGRIVSSAGRSGASATWGQAANWCDYSGTQGKLRPGITLMAATDNFRGSWWHNRDYGVFVANPFGRAAMKQGERSEVRVPRGEVFRLEFAAVLHDAAEYSAESAWEWYSELSGGQKPSSGR